MDLKYREDLKHKKMKIKKLKDKLQKVRERERDNSLVERNRYKSYCLF